MVWQRVALIFLAAGMVVMMFVKGRHRGAHPSVSAFRPSALPAGWLQITGDVRFQGTFPLSDTKMTKSVIVMAEPLCLVPLEHVKLESALKTQVAIRLNIACPSADAYGLASIMPLPADQRLVLLGTVSLNSATADELCLVPGIGPVLAQRIVQYRQINGEFGRFEDLLQIKGVAEKKLATLKRYLTI